MVKLNTIVKFLNNELKIRSIKDESKNGLQIRASDEVRKIGLGVDACMETFIKAKKLGCNLVIVHHGLFWKGKKDFANKVRIKYLKKNNISVYAVHLPLDKNMDYGNNVTLFKMLNAKPKEIIGRVGYIGYLEKTESIDSVARELEKKLKTKCKVWKFGKTRIKKIAIISGSGRGYLNDCILKKVDAFITGEVSHGTYRGAKDAKMSIIIGGHYKTETVGVKNLGKLLEKKFKVKSVFIDAPTGM
jgi:dinuclear metal center YbgI/SA1388 family protein